MKKQIKNIVKSMVAASLITTTLFAGEVSVDGFKKLPIVTKMGANITKAYDHGSLYEIEFTMLTPRGMQSTTAYITKDKKAILFGEAYKLDGMKPLTIPLDVAAIKSGADLVFGSGKKEYFLFTDPECHYCKMFEQSWPRIEKDVKIYVYYMPLSQHYNAKKMTYYIMHQKTNADKASASIRMTNGDRSFESASISKKEMAAFEKKIAKNQAFAQRMGVRGTPSLYDFDGNVVNWQLLVQ